MFPIWEHQVRVKQWNGIEYISSTNGNLLALTIGVTIKWEARIVEEFTNQVKMERERNLPLTGFMVDLDSHEKRGGLQINFIRLVVLPMWTSLVAFDPSLTPCLSP